MSQVRVSEVLKLLKKNGFHEVSNRQSGDHHRFMDENGHKVTIPFASKKAVVAPGTYNSILKQAGLK
ncbi:type II toxin-antitoxin system HicA family toxin [Lentilactobacillus raoultii]|uniref:Type II toxin-antitoxin system HicA family toxin n=1 Tax=Lentilactobacillus raoultii TaxID=1987503 RepID=A0ABW3PDR1_9LACO|nr:type II toxin-antitoxin system HicA family toxin [Lentilactobacillus raoultii]